MSVIIPAKLFGEICADGEAAYPEEGAGFILGHVSGETRIAQAILKRSNGREAAARHNRYLLTSADFLSAEQEAARRGLDILGVFHSHPDHPDRPSEFDREWALPWFSYLITSVQAGRAAGSRSWRLVEDRSQFVEEPVLIEELEG